MWLGMKIKLTDKLSILQVNDHFRDWNMLDDERVCLLCGRRFSGHEVLISTADEEVEMHCPTPDCKSGVHQWIYPVNPLISEKTYQDWWHALGRKPFRGRRRRRRCALSSTHLKFMIAPTLTTDGFSSATDEALMGAITDRNESALAALYERHGETLRSIIESVIHEQAEAEDVLQETLLQIWKQAQNYAPRVGKPLGWLTTITRRRAIDRLRRRQAYIRVKDRYQEQINELPNGASTTVDGDEEMERADLRRYLREQMSALPKFQRQAVELSFFTGMSHREIAASTDNPLGTVKTRLELGLQKLHAWLKPVQHKI